jgi:hypothetical protein
MQASSYAVADADLPSEMDACKDGSSRGIGTPPTRNVTVVPSPTSGGVVTPSEVASQCGHDSVCVVPFGITLRMIVVGGGGGGGVGGGVGVVSAGLNLGALIVRGVVEWYDDAPPESSAQSSSFLCAGYVAVEGQGRFAMDVSRSGGNGKAYVYIKDNGAVHGVLRSRAFGTAATNPGDYPVIDIRGREMSRTWSLLSRPIVVGDGKMTLMHDANLMGW